MSSVVVTMAWFVMSVRKDGEVAFGLMRRESWLALTERLGWYSRRLFCGILLGRHFDGLLVVLGIFRGGLFEARANALSAVRAATAVFVGRW